MKQMKKIILSVIMALLCAGPAAAPGQAGSAAQPAARAWPEADRIFHGDPRWRGGDGASSVDLGRGRILWLFGDSLVCESPPYERKRAGLVRNSVMVETGPDPLTASAAFFWGREKGRPAAFFPGRGAAWRWPASGVALSGRLLVFLMNVKPAENALGFAPAGWSAVFVKKPSQSPELWRAAEAKLPPGRQDGLTAVLLAGSGGAAPLGGHLLCWGQAAATGEAFLMRFSLAEAARGDLSRPSYWDGPEHGFVPPERLRGRKPAPLFSGAPAEFSVHRQSPSGAFLVISALGFGSADLSLRRGPRPSGPFSEPASFFRPPEWGRPGVLLYAAKAHPEISAPGGLAVTYASNSLDPETVLADESLYYPRFVLLEMN